MTHARILVIDDETINHQLVAHALESQQAELHFAENGKTGIAKAHAIKPDVIITDVMMPDINGYEVTRILRRESWFAAIPILVLTAQPGLQEKLKSFEAGADDHFNHGQPFVFAIPQEATSGLLEDFSLFLSKDTNKKAKPDNPSEAWKRAYKRHQERKK